MLAPSTLVATPRRTACLRWRPGGNLAGVGEYGLLSRSSGTGGNLAGAPRQPRGAPAQVVANNVDDGIRAWSDALSEAARALSELREPLRSVDQMAALLYRHLLTYDPLIDTDIPMEWVRDIAYPLLCRQWAGGARPSPRYNPFVNALSDLMPRGRPDLRGRPDDFADRRRSLTVYRLRAPKDRKLEIVEIDQRPSALQPKDLRAVV